MVSKFWTIVVNFQTDVFSVFLHDQIPYKCTLLLCLQDERERQRRERREKREGKDSKDKDRHREKDRDRDEDRERRHREDVINFIVFLLS